ncbi:MULTISPECIES: DUF402 domain-containing protein [unclassified Paenibacillus]|uniref:DUF402 domain-containing protein n=1 Tax=Paenibacillus provencensis TaxID=441151 RepID=A0ABW3PS07_9BACL|nr:MULTISPECIES: DUF402 domain-containing protein [unclassified Paenibacillus]MCM3126930.1 DUF402 domain-containing protein [Paenibacillus sp. MER 78]SFS57267.1 Protein of unknown function [Paenibacillus sp. 453mf]
MKPLTVTSRLGEFQGYGTSEVAFFDRFDELSNKVIRHYILIHEGVKIIHEPWGWTNEWYVDLVDIKMNNDAEIVLTDLYIDIVIEGNGPTYRLIDLEEYADAVSQGLICTKDMNKHLTQVQLFLEKYLHRGKVFPPKQIEVLQNFNITQENF